MSGGTAAGFQYDAFGRRTSKTINSQSTQYLHDGANVVQELGGGVPTANMLNGLGVDERHTCNCNGGSSTLLTDGLGSALALTDSSGAVQTQYTYDAFGNTTSSGAASNNSSQYTGRENDGTGLYYYRARYYSPTLQRFVSEDPIGFAGGDVNLYGYVGNSPVNFTDPSGMVPAPVAACLGGAAFGGFEYALFNTLAGRKITLSGLVGSALMGCGMGLVALGLGKALGLVLRRMGPGARRGGNVVYQSINATGDVQYVGITNNPARRAAEHLASPRALEITPIPGLQNLSRADARAVEQVLINHYALARNGGTLLNRINSIARKNPIYADAIRRGTQILRQAGYPGF
jgi:RHS repeat-associated protein